MFKQCPACTAITLDGSTFYVTRVVSTDGVITRVQDVPLSPSSHYTRVCQYSKKEGCINQCREISEADLFTNRC